jgi:hypothetical protein
MKKQLAAEDFAARVNAAALARAPELVREWFPSGRRFGDLWLCEEIPDRPGFSCWVNLVSGQWQIFPQPNVPKP